jgi:hypothetical protein
MTETVLSLERRTDASCEARARARDLHHVIGHLGRGPLPAMRDEDDPAPGGHGLRLVDALADDWGVERGSTRVWFELHR